MDNTQRVIVVLLVLAILFSGISIFVSYAALNIDVPRTSGGVVEESGGGISLSIERPPIQGGEG